tara:strand:+ start:194 stop:448 length:255 start_codon:yes stop_codon:yes gene_type:complete
MIRKKLLEKYDELLFADNFDEAIIGVAYDGNTRVVYDINKMIEIFVKDNNAKYEEAVEFLEFNTLFAHVGDQTPIYVNIINKEN